MIQQSRGLRQCCPLSPFLFVMCMERLGQWLARRVAEGCMREVKASRHGHGLSYLLFAYDLLMFSEENADQLACIKEGMYLFCSCSCQRVNYTKSSMFCSANVSEQVVVSPTNQLGIPLRSNMGKYLGHYIAQGGNNRMPHKEFL